jgi:hypothetical protein
VKPLAARPIINMAMPSWPLCPARASSNCPSWGGRSGAGQPEIYDRRTEVGVDPQARGRQRPPHRWPAKSGPAGIIKPPTHLAEPNLAKPSVRFSAGRPRRLHRSDFARWQRRWSASEAERQIAVKSATQLKSEFATFVKPGSDELTTHRLQTLHAKSF